MIRINIHFDEAYPKDAEKRSFLDGILYALTTGRDRKSEAVICSTHVPNVVCVHGDTLSDISQLSSAQQVSSHQVMDFYRQADYLVVQDAETAKVLEKEGFDISKITVIPAYPDPADPAGKKQRRQVTALWDEFLQKVYEQSSSKLRKLSKKVL